MTMPQPMPFFSAVNIAARAGGDPGYPDACLFAMAAAIRDLREAR